MGKNKMPDFWRMSNRKLFSPTTIDVWNSKAFQELSGTQVKLWVFCAMQWAPSQKQTELPINHFLMNGSMYKQCGWRKDAFIRDMTALIEKGFINCAKRGDRDKSVYCFSDRWKVYGTKEGTPKPSECNKPLLCRLYPEVYAKEYLRPSAYGKDL